MPDANPMRIVLPGGSGQLGSILAREFHAAGNDVVVLSRSPAPAPWNVVPWDARSVGPWCEQVDGAHLVINLAGRSVNCRYTEKNRRLIMDSRVESTRAIVSSIQQARTPPPVWLQLSTATIYSHRFDAPNDEIDGEIGGREPDAPASWAFSVDVARAWEAAALQPDLPSTRVVALRSAVVMSPDEGGIFDVMLGLVRRGLGGKSGSGRQFVSWVHDRDFVGAIKWLAEADGLSGPVNISSPHPLPNAEFMAEFRKAWGARVGLPATTWMLEMGALLMGTETELVLKSRRVYPRRLLESGFDFRFPEWRSAVEDLCARYRARDA